MSGGGGGGSQQTTTGIPEELKPLAKAYTSKALNLGEQSFTPYTSQRYADFTGDQSQAMDLIRSRATGGDPTVNMATSNLQQMMQGGTNPYLDAMVGKAQQSVMGQANNAAIKSGSFGNSGINEQASKQMGDIATQMYGGAYEGDQARRMQAIGMAPQFGNLAYQDAGQLMNIGQMQQDQGQQGLDFNYQQFMDQQNLPYKQLSAMAAPFSSNLGMNQTTTQSGGGK